MIRQTLRQFRTEAIVACGVLGVLAIVLAATGPHLAHINDAFQRACKAEGNCATAPSPFLGVDVPLQGGLPLVVTIAPALIGLFFGAPLIARELETGTFRLSWTQSVTRERWLLVKLGLLGLASMAVAGLLTWMIDWWATPLDAVAQNRFDLGAFGWHGIAPIGYAAFAFALGVSAGLLLRRTVPAMAVTLAGFVAARLAVEHWLRPHLASPLHRSLPLRSSGFGTLQLSAPSGATSYSLAPPPETIPNSWVLSTRVVDRSGHVLTGKHFLHACPAYGQFASAPPQPATVSSAHAECIAKLAGTYHTAITYQPANRFWLFQWIEMGLFLAAALALCGFAYWWLRHQFG